MIRLLLHAVALCLIAAQIIAAEEEPFLSYREDPALSRYKEISITIEKSGRTSVVVEKKRRLSYSAQLGREEMEALHVLIRATDFFSQPDKDPTFATDVGQTEITVNETDRHRTLKFGYRPTLQPLSEFLWKILAQAEAWEALQAGDVYDTMGAIVLSDTRAKALQPFVLKKPLMEFLRAAHEPRQTDSALAALAAIMTPEEFAGFVAEQRQSDREARPIIGPFSSYTKNHQLALCPVWLDYLKEKYPQPNDFARPDKFNTASGLCNLLGELRYEPAIPYFLQIFDAQKEAGFSAPLSALGRIGAPCLYQLNARLDSPAQAHRLNAMEIMTVVFRNNYKNAVPNPVSEWEFDQMRRTFNEMILPKLTKVAEADAVPAVRAKAAETIATIKTELTKPDEMTGPFIKLSVTAERILRRTALENENGRTVSWHFIKDGHPLIQIASQGRTEQKVEDRGPGVYTVYVSVWSKGDYRIVSNVVSYTIDSSGFKID